MNHRALRVSFLIPDGHAEAVERQDTAESSLSLLGTLELGTTAHVSVCAVAALAAVSDAIPVKTAMTIPAALLMRICDSLRRRCSPLSQTQIKIISNPGEETSTDRLIARGWHVATWATTRKFQLDIVWIPEVTGINGIGGLLDAGMADAWLIQSRHPGSSSLRAAHQSD